MLVQTIQTDFQSAPESQSTPLQQLEAYKVCFLNAAILSWLILTINFLFENFEKDDFEKCYNFLAMDCIKNRKLKLHFDKDLPLCLCRFPVLHWRWRTRTWSLWATNCFRLAFTVTTARSLRWRSICVLFHTMSSASTFTVLTLRANESQKLVPNTGIRENSWLIRFHWVGTNFPEFDSISRRDIYGVFLESF